VPDVLAATPVVVDAHLRSSLAGIRGLGRARHEVVGLAAGRAAIGLRSRYAAPRRVNTRQPGPGGLVEALVALARERSSLVVYPGQEATIDALLTARHALPAKVQLPYPRPDSLRAVRDKHGLAALASDAGLAAPRLLVRTTAGELSRWQPPEPCVVKPVGPAGALATARVIRSPEELRTLLAVLPDDEPVMVQERARGPLTAVSLVIDGDGGLVARFQQEAGRTWPPEAGASSVATSVPPDEPLVRRVEAMLGSAGYAGLAHVQFVQVLDGPVVIDVNPRFYGSMPLATACGVNLPAAWHASLTGRAPPRPGAYRTGVTYRWLEGELRNALRAGRPPADALRESARVVLRPPPRPRTGSVWARDDPLPGLFACWSLATALGARYLRR
jgi:predicted ATP-grasp superfamily ATP-dependent carboligase